jgi:hypothetical protein
LLPILAISNGLAAYPIPRRICASVVRGRRVKELLKKQTEVSHLLRFRQNLPAFPEGMVCVGEAPDFLVNTGHGYVGIEHTQWFRESDAPGGSRMRARESAEVKVLRFASSRYEARGLPPVWVNILWSLPDLPTSRIPELANALADIVEVHLPKQDGEVAIKHPHPGWSSLPPEVSYLSIRRKKFFSKNLWVPTRGAFIPTLAPLDLQKRIRKKEGKVTSYRQKCSQVWLLIVANGFEPSTFGELAPEIEEFPFETSFDRVFFLHHADELMVELKTRGLRAGGT